MIATASRFFVRLTAAIFLGFGIASIAAPVEVLRLATGAVVDHPIGLIDLRATYGGMSLGVAAALFVLSASRALIRHGLMVVIALMVGMASARLAGMLIEQTANAVMVAYLMLEIAAASVAAWLLVAGASADAHTSPESPR